MATRQEPPAARSRSDWSSSLPSELLELIANRLASGTDAASFRSVCPAWRAAVPFAASFAPLLLLPFGPLSDRVTLYSVDEGKALSLPLPAEARGAVPCGASCGWVALTDASAAVALLNPFTGTRVELPPADAEVAASSLTLVTKEEGGDGRRWVRHDEDDYGDEADAACAVTLDEVRQVFFHDIVLSAPPDADGRGCVAVAVLPSSTEIAFCRVGVDSAWTLVETYLECSVDSVVYCQGRLVAIDCTGEVSICTDIAGPGTGTPTATPMPSLSPPEDLYHRSYQELNGELYVMGALLDVFRWAQGLDYSSVVYRCNLLDPRPAWSRVHDAGDLTLFVSVHFRHSFGGAGVSTMKRNGVYFSEPLYGNHKDSVHSLQIADIGTGKSEVKHFHQKVQAFEPLGWIRPNLWRGREGTPNRDEENPQEEAAPGPA